MNEEYLPICTHCYAVRVEPHRARLLRPTCMGCGEILAKQVKRTVVPMHKSNYFLCVDPADLKGINNKGGLVR
jgi:transposase-like protein